MEPRHEQKNPSNHMENIKAKLQSAKEELKRRYGEPIEKIKDKLSEDENESKDNWDNLKTRI